MGIPVGELKKRISSREFAEYCAYDTIDPYGNQRTDFQIGLVCSTICNIMGGDTSPIDFMYDNIVSKGKKNKRSKIKKPIQSWQQMEAILVKSITETNKKFKK